MLAKGCEAEIDEQLFFSSQWLPVVVDYESPVCRSHPSKELVSSWCLSQLWLPYPLNNVTQPIEHQQSHYCTCITNIIQGAIQVVLPNTVGVGGWQISVKKALTMKMYGSTLLAFWGGGWVGGWVWWHRLPQIVLRDTWMAPNYDKNALNLKHIYLPKMFK